jgi:hypothetical protein
MKENLISADTAEKSQNVDAMGYMMLGVGGIFGVPILIEGAVIYSPYMIQAVTWTGRTFYTGGRHALHFAKQPFVAATGRYGTTLQITSYYQIGNFTADATNQIMSGNNLQTWNYGASLGNLYFSDPRYSSLLGSAYSAFQGKSFNYILSNGVVNYGFGRLGSVVKNAGFMVNPWTQHAFGAGIIPFYTNLGNSLLNPIKD